MAAGSALGGVFRYLGSISVKGNGFPWATFSVNVLGSLAIGLLSGFLIKSSSLSDGSLQLVRCFAVVGVCGGFTTFSTFSSETFRMLESSQWGMAALYVLSSLALGVLAVFLGYLISR